MRKQLFRILFSMLLLLIPAHFLSAQTPQNIEQNYLKEIRNLLYSKENSRILKLIETIEADTNDFNKTALIFRLKIDILERKYLANPSKESIYILDSLEQLVEIQQGVSKNVGYAILAQYYHNFALNNIQFLLTKDMLLYNEKDKQTWTWKNFIEKAVYYQEKSIEGEEIKKEAAQKWNIFFNIKLGKTQDYSTEIQSTLYDVLMMHLLKMYQVEYSYLSNPSQNLNIKDEQLFAPTNDFIKANFNLKDNKNTQAKIISTFQNWLAFNKSINNDFALAEIELYRIEYALAQSIATNKIDLYESAFNRLRTTYKNTIVGAYLDFKFLNYLQQNTANLKEENIVPIINNIKNNPNLDSLMKIDIIRYEALFNKRYFNIQLEPIVPINQPILISVDYRYIDTLYYNIFKIKTHLSDARNKFKQTEKDSLIASKYWLLEGNKKRSLEKTEVPLQGLPSGEYYLIVSTNKDFEEKDTSSLLYIDFSVTNMAFIQNQQQPNHNINNVIGYLVDRNTGEAIDLKKVKVKSYYLDKKTVKDLPYSIQDNRLTIDYKDSYLYYDNRSNYNNYTIAFINGNDTLFHGQRQSYNNYDPEQDIALPKESRYNAIYLYTDRAIYRPGQTVYLKGISLNYIHNRIDPAPKAINGSKYILSLVDTKGNDILKDTVVTNEFGSFDAVLDIPLNLQLGIYSIRVGNTRKEISVEEYKRPQFYIEQLYDKGIYILGDSVKIKGKAMAYAGNALSGAKVNYTLKRDNNIIKDSTLFTDNKGEFLITFLSEKDKAELPFPNEKHVYTLRTDIVDITGETISNTITLAIGNLAQEIDIAMPDYVLQNDKVDVKIIAKDLQGNTSASIGKIQVYEIENGANFYVNRLWAFPSVKNISKSNFEKLFPQYAYEDKPSEKTKLVISAEFDTKKSLYYDLPTHKLSVGAYKIVLTSKDKSGKELISEKKFIVYNEKEGSVRTTALLIPKSVYTVEKDATLSIPIYTKNKNSFVLVEMQTQYGIVFSKVLKVDCYYNLELPIKEIYGAAFKMHFVSISNNRIYNKSIDVNVVAPSKAMKIELVTFRDKMQAGEEETWKVKVATLDGKEANAELLVAMYDASLDAFKSNYWALPNFQNKPSLQNYYPFALNDKKSFITTAIGPDFAPSNFYYRFGQFVNWSNANYVYRDYNGFIYQNSTKLQYYFNNRIYNFIDNENITKLATKSITDLKAMKTGVVQRDAGMDTHTAGARSTSDDIDRKPKRRRNTISEDNYYAPEIPNDTLPNPSINTAKNTFSESSIVMRENLNETVFFYPHVEKNKAGEYVINFKMNEALTRWKFMLFAHDKNMNWTSQEHYVITQKDLMIQPNAPRFLRQGDTIAFPAKVSNLTANDISGNAYLQIFDALTQEPLDSIFVKGSMAFPFNIKANDIAVINWTIIVPDNFNGIINYKVIAKTDKHSDGESNHLPILPNQSLVIKHLPISVDKKGEKTYEFDAMKSVMANSNTMQHYNVELKLNASTLASTLSALNFLQAYPYQCSEQLLSVYYANVMGNYLLKNNPALYESVEDKSLLKKDKIPARVMKIVHAEANYLLENHSINSNLFKDKVVKKELNNIMNLLASRQNTDGGLSWYGGSSDLYTTQTWLKGMGEFLDKGMIKAQGKTFNILKDAIDYLDNSFMKYEELTYNYLYTRSLYEKLFPVSKAIETRRAELLAKPWHDLSLFDKIKLGISAYNLGKKDLSKDLVKDIKSIIGNIDSFEIFQEYPYYYNKIELYAQLIELLFKVNKTDPWITDIKTYLLKNKQGNAWGSTKTTTQVLYALFFYNEEKVTAKNQDLSIEIGQEKIAKTDFDKLSKQGRLNKIFTKVNPDFTTVKISNNNIEPINGNLVWRYFEDFDKVSNEENAEIKKTLFIRKSGDKFEELNENNPIKVGDLVRVRLEIKVKSPLGYVQVKDMRAAGFEPIDVLSKRENSGKLSYYKAVSDASMNFFIDNLQQGTYVLEYYLRATYKGNYNNGVTSVESMYAPEKTAYSKAIRLTIE